MCVRCVREVCVRGVCEVCGGGVCEELHHIVQLHLLMLKVTV